LITTEGAKAAAAHVRIWNKAIDDFGGDMARAMAWWDDIEAKRERYKQGLLNMPKQIDIRISTIHQTIGDTSPGAHIPTLGKQHGGYATGLTMVGEAGPELVFLPRGSYVLPNPQTRQVVQNNQQVGSNNTYNIHGGEAMALLMTRERVQRRESFGGLR
jgi:hypothetical protein